MPKAIELFEATGRSVAATVRIPAQGVPASVMRRIYWMRAINDPTSRQATVTLLIQQVTQGNTVQNKDTMMFTTRGETQYLPEDLIRNSLPLWSYNPQYATRFLAVNGTVLIRHLFAEEQP